MRKTNIFSRLLSILLCLALLLTYLPAFTLRADAAIEPFNKVTDPSTKDSWVQLFGSGNDFNTENAGSVWTDKSVFTDASAFSNITTDSRGNATGITMDRSDGFLVALSAMGSNMSITGQASIPTDTMLVLDVSGSMNDNSGNNDVAEELVQAANQTIDALLTANPSNRVGVVLYSGPTSVSGSSTSTDAVLVLPLGRYTTGTNKQYLTYGVSSSWGSTTETISTNSNVRYEDTNRRPSSVSKTVEGATYIQKGVILAMNQFTDSANQTTVDGLTRKPIMVLMSDGAPTVTHTNFTNPGSYDLGTGAASSTNAAQGFCTQLSCAYAKYRMEDKYQTDALFYTVGLGTTGDEVATSVLDPVNSNSGINTFWTRYAAAAVNGTVTVEGSGNNARRVTKIAQPLEKTYVDKYIAIEGDSSQELAEGLIEAFQSIISDISLQSRYFPTLVGDNEDVSGYITFVDQIGAYMSVTDVKGILLNEQLFSGADLSHNFVAGGGDLGTTQNPTALGDEMVFAVRTRLGLPDNETARTLIGLAYQYGQLSYTDNNNFSNYIGWYANASGQFLGFYNEGTTTLPEATGNAATDPFYTIKSYGYLGYTDPAHGVAASDMMYATVQVRHEIVSGHETVMFQIPAALLPLVSYDVTLDADGQLEALERSGANYPIRLLYEVGLDSHINTRNIRDIVSEEYRNTPGAVNADGSINFYSNAYNVNGQTGYGTENANTYFNPSRQNDKYYYTQNAIIYSSSSGTPYTGDTSPANYNGTLYRSYPVYERNGSRVNTRTVYRPLSAQARATAQRVGSNWQILAGNVHVNMDGYTVYKGGLSQYSAAQNITGTLQYANLPFVDTTNHSVNDTGYNFYVGATLGNNGKLTVMPETGIKLTKALSEGTTAPDTQFQFALENLTNPSDSSTYAAVIEEADGRKTSTTVSFSGGKATALLKAGQILYITGMTAGTRYSITETETLEHIIESVNGDDTAKVATVTITAGQLAKIDFVNTQRGKGNLMITKEVSHKLSEHMVPESVLEQQFPLTVTIPQMPNTDLILVDGTNESTVRTDANGVLSLSIRHGQTLELKDLPAGVDATVAELLDNVPAYFLRDYTIRTRDHSGAQQDTDKRVTIYKNANATAILGNTYDPGSVNVDLDVKINKNFQIESSLEETATFNFKLQQWRDGSWVDMKTESVSYANESGMKSVTMDDVLVGITYTEPGTYGYQVLEVIPTGQDRIDGVSYDRTLYTFSVVVTDVGGRLEAAVSDDGVPVQGGLYEVTFTNTYHTAPVSIDIVKEVKNTANNPETSKVGFQFDAYEANPDWTLVDNAPDMTILSDAAGEARMAATYDAEGIHYFVVREADTGKAGWTYDDTEYRITVTVTEEADGNMTADMAISKVLDGQTTEEVTGNTLTFSNTYDPTDAPVDLDAAVHKNLMGRPLKAGEFTFAVFYDGQSSHTSTADALLVGKNAADGSVDFDGVLTFDKIGSYALDVVEITGSLGGVAYSTRIYDMVVEVTDDGSGQLEADYYFEDATTTEVTFTNRYTTDSAAYTVSGTKTLTGRVLLNDEFTFQMTEVADVNGTALPNAKTWETTNTVDDTYQRGSFSFETITYTEPGTHYYLVTEKQDSGADYGITYDDARFIVTVTVKDNGQGKLVVEDAISGGQTIAFNNRYVPNKTQNAIPGDKVLTGKVLGAGAFQFQLYSANSNWEEGSPIGQPVTNDANGKFQFPAAEYTTEGTYYYIVKEVNGGQTIEGITYDDTVFRVKVEVKDDLLGQLHATTTVFDQYDIPQVGVQFINRYEVTGDASLVINATKTLSGRDAEDGEFTFDLYQTAEDYSILSNAQPIASSDNKSGQVTFKLDYVAAEDLDQTYYYVLVEEHAGLTINGVTYHSTYNTYKVVLEDDGQGGLKLTATSSDPETRITTENGVVIASGYEFVNTYEADPTEIIFEGTKVLDGIRPLKADDFTFDLYETDQYYRVSGAPIQSKKNDANGKFTFDAQVLEEAKDYYFVIRESADNAIGGVRYDDSTYRIHLTVKDGLLGELHIERTEITKVDSLGTPGAADSILFENTYVPADAQVTLSGVKTLSGMELEAGKFSFRLYETDSQFANGELLDTRTNAADGSYSFDPLTFAAEGTCYYQVVEVNGGSTIDGITYDDAVYNITVAVEDNGNGKLIPTVTVSNANAQISENENVVAVDNILFENTYQAAPVDYTPQVQKLYERDETVQMEKFDFVLTVDGNDKQIKQNDAEGKVVFDPLTFETAGVYQLKIREQENILWGLIRWDVNVYTVTLHVEDDGAGRLFVNENKTVVTSEKGRDDLVYRNAHHSVITEKDVFLPAEPEISIDGKTVEKNDILLYKISYTNYDSVPVDIEITDVIPKYTAYVDGSADNGGAFAGNTLHWTLEGVAPDATVTVSFRVKVVDANVTVVNGAAVVEGENQYHTNEVKNPVKEDTAVKDVFAVSKPTVSIDGKTVEKGDVLLYTITYKNADDFPADVTITDAIPQYAEYVAGSADNGGAYAGGKLTWNLTLEAGESKTVSFQVKVNEYSITVTNQATALEGQNGLQTNIVTNKTAAPPETPQTGDNTHPMLWICLLTVSAVSMFVLIISRKRIVR